MVAQYFLGLNRTLINKTISVLGLASFWANVCLLVYKDGVSLRGALRAYTLFALMDSASTLLKLFALPAAVLPRIPLWYQIVGAVVMILVRERRWLPEPYGLYHIELNEGNAEWGNMGYWKDATIFEEACEALALMLIRAGNCEEGGRVLDVGHGTGDSLLLHLTHPAVFRPYSLMGITSIPSQYLHAKTRVTSALSSLPSPSPSVTIFCADAVSRAPATNFYNKLHEPELHPLWRACPSPPFNTILALDCAYHFNTRELFLKQAFGRLSPGGTLALADSAFLTYPDVGLHKCLVRAFIAVLMGIPAVNVVSPKAYERQLLEIGFGLVEMEDITDDVYLGFAAHLRKRPEWKWRVFSYVLCGWRWAGARFLIVSARKSVGVSKTE